VLLGMVGPLAIKLSARSLGEVGRVAGDVFAASTIASVLGALATGFWLVPLVGVRGLTLLVAGALFVAAAIARFAGHRRPATDAVVAVMLLAAGAALLWSGRAARDAAANARAESAVSALPVAGRLVDLVESPYAELCVVDFKERRYLLVDGGAHTIEQIDAGVSRHPYVPLAELPEDLFDRPASRFAAEFMGFDNVLPCTVRAVFDNDEARVDFNGIALSGVCASGAHLKEGDSALFAVRAERLAPILNQQAAHAGNVIACAPADHIYRGKYTDQTARMADSTRLKIRSWDQSATPGQFDAVTCRAQDCVILPH